jgi:hypothetical protein
MVAEVSYNNQKPHRGGKFRVPPSASPVDPVVDSTTAAPVTCSKPKTAALDYRGGNFGE